MTNQKKDFRKKKKLYNLVTLMAFFLLWEQGAHIYIWHWTLQCSPSWWDALPLSLKASGQEYTPVRETGSSYSGDIDQPQETTMDLGVHQCRLSPNPL